MKPRSSVWLAGVLCFTACSSDKADAPATAAPSAVVTTTSTAHPTANTAATSAAKSAAPPDPALALPTSTSAKSAHAELSVHKVTTPASVADEVPGVRKGTTTPDKGSKFVLVEAAIRTLDCVIDTGGPPPAASAGPAPIAPKIAPVASEAAALVSADGTRVPANGGGETADSVCTGCDTSYNPTCTGDKPPDALVTMFFLFSVPASFDLSNAAFQYADAKAKLPAVTK